MDCITVAWVEQMEHVYRINDINPRCVITLPLASEVQMKTVYCECDVGLFPNRREEGTNLVLMEDMACG